nr:Chain B, Uncharacterized protein YejA [Escherichia coli K-12]
LGEPRYAFNFN